MEISISTLIDLMSKIQDIMHNEKMKSKITSLTATEDREKLSAELHEQDVKIIKEIVNFTNAARELIELDKCKMPFVTLAFRGLVEMLWGDPRFTGFYLEEEVKKRESKLEEPYKKLPPETKEV